LNEPGTEFCRYKLTLVKLLWRNAAELADLDVAVTETAAGLGAIAIGAVLATAVGFDMVTGWRERSIIRKAQGPHTASHCSQQGYFSGPEMLAPLPTGDPEHARLVVSGTSVLHVVRRGAALLRAKEPHDKSAGETGVSCCLPFSRSWGLPLL